MGDVAPDSRRGRGGFQKVESDAKAHHCHGQAFNGGREFDNSALARYLFFMTDWKYIALIFIVTFIAHGIPVVYRIYKGQNVSEDKERDI